MFRENGYCTWPGTLSLPSIIKSKPIGKVIIEAIFRSVIVDKIKVKFYRRIGIFEQAFCEVIAPLLPDCKQ